MRLVQLNSNFSERVRPQDCLQFLIQLLNHLSTWLTTQIKCQYLGCTFKTPDSTFLVPCISTWCTQMLHLSQNTMSFPSSLSGERHTSQMTSSSYSIPRPSTVSMACFMLSWHWLSSASMVRSIVSSSRGSSPEEKKKKRETEEWFRGAHWKSKCSSSSLEHTDVLQVWLRWSFHPGFSSNCPHPCAPGLCWVRAASRGPCCPGRSDTCSPPAPWCWHNPSLPTPDWRIGCISSGGCTAPPWTSLL